jgi:hypothetical protein
MNAKVREYIEYWVENSVHAAEQFRTAGASQDVEVLVGRLIEGAKVEGISEQAMRDEVGDLTEYLRAKLSTANEVEQARHRPAPDKDAAN